MADTWHPGDRETHDAENWLWTRDTVTDLWDCPDLGEYGWTLARLVEVRGPLASPWTAVTA